MTVRVSVAGDYAVIEGDGVHCYYGYEYDYPVVSDGATDLTWGFEFKRDGQSVLRLGYADLAAQQARPLDVFDVPECLLVGLGVVLERRL